MYTGLAGVSGCCSNTPAENYPSQIIERPNTKPPTPTHTRGYDQGEETPGPDV